MLQGLAIEPSMGSDERINDPVMRNQLMLTADNYEFHVEPRQGFNWRPGLLRPGCEGTKSERLPDQWQGVGRRETCLLVRVQGTQSKSLSLWAGIPLITRDFANVNGFAMVVHEKIEAHNFLLGQTVEEIDYRDYKVTGDAKPIVR